MPSVLFWKCDCGIEWQAIQNSDHKLTIIACVCGRRRTVKGKAIGLYYAPVGSHARPVPLIGKKSLSINSRSKTKHIIKRN